MRDSKKRLKLINKLMKSRKNWTIEDYRQSYLDEWDEIPKTLIKCKEMMEEYIYHTYDTDLIKECLENS